ncbi:hypothetical protein RUND412_000324 [Rhizina undulata]
MPKPPSSPKGAGFIPLEQMNPFDSETERSPSRSGDDHIINIPTNATSEMGGGSEKEGRERGQSIERTGTASSDEGAYFDRHIGRRRARKAETGGDAALIEDEGALTAMGVLYEKVLNFSIVTRYFIYVLPLSLCLLVPILVGLSSAPHAAIGGNGTPEDPGVRIVWFFAWLEIVWGSLWVSKLVTKLLPGVFQALVGVVNSSVRKYALVIQALEVPISLVGWAIASLCSFVPLMTRNPDQLRIGDTSMKEWQSRVNLVLISGFISSMVFLGEKLIIQIVSVDYHRQQFAQRIRANKENVRFLSRLYEASKKLFPVYTEFVEEDYIILQGVIPALLTPGVRMSGSLNPIKNILGNINLVQEKVTNAFGNIAQEVTGNKNVFNPNSAYSVVINALHRKSSAEALAQRIWMSFVPEGSTALTLDDLLEVMGPDHEEKAKECFQALDADSNGDVSLDEMVLHVLHVYNERRSLAKSMQDVDNAIRALDKVLLFIVFIIVVIVFVVFQQTSIGTTIAGAGTVLISMSFVFSLTAQEVLGSCIFLFVKHPYDVGDRVDIDDTRLIVEHISLLFTVFKRVDDNKMTQIPNNVLNTKVIDNVSRSAYMRENIKIGVDYGTTFEDIQKLRELLLLFVQENSRDFQPDLEVEVVGVNQLDKLEIKVEIIHKSNWANNSLTLQRRNRFFCALVQILKQIPIYGPGQGDATVGDQGKPMYTVTITDDKAQENMATAMEQKLSKRWDYTPPAPRPPPAPTSESEITPVPNPNSGNASSATVTGVESFPGSQNLSPFSDSVGRRKSNASSIGKRSGGGSLRGGNGEGRGFLNREPTRGRRRPVRGPDLARETLDE